MDPPFDPPGSETGQRLVPTRDADGVARLSLPHSDQAPAMGRAFVADALRRWKLEALVETAVLLTSELVTNAVVHARSTSTLSVGHNGSTIRIELLDRGHGKVALRRSSPGGVGGGRGLYMVDQLATAWGSAETNAGTTVWFELTTGVADGDQPGVGQAGVTRSAANADRTAR